jgi:hypothetical protein
MPLELILVHLLRDAVPTASMRPGKATIAILVKRMCIFFPSGGVDGGLAYAWASMRGAGEDCVLR